MSDSTGLRLSALAIVALSLLGALTARLWFLTAVEGEAAVAAADANRIRTLHIQAPRGRILDRNQRLLVDNRQVSQVRVDLRDLNDAVDNDADRRDAVLQRLAEELTRAGVETTLDDIHTALEDPRGGPYLPVPVASEVPEDLEILLAENQMQFPGIDVERVAVRHYPHESLAANVLGYVGAVNQNELDGLVDSDKPYEPGDEIGKSGVELSYEPWLRGVPGRRVIEVDADGNVIRQVDYDPPEPGMDVVLSIDLQIQTLLETQLIAAADLHDAPGAAGVVEDPRDGSILAMASVPTFNPQDFVGGISQREYDVLDNENSGFPLINKAISGEYAPGSTFKLVTAVAGLRAEVIHPNESFNDDGRYEVVGCETNPTCWFRNAGEIPNGTVNLQRSLTVSSDWYYYRVGDNLWARNEDIGDDFLERTAHDFGVAADTGIDLPEERDGFAFTPEILAQLHEDNPEAFPNGDQWVAGFTINQSIGQGDLGVTPLQLTNMYAALANGGNLYRPHVASAVWEPRPELNRWYTDDDAACADHVGARCTVLADDIGRVNLPPRWRDPIMAGLLGVTQSSQGGTAGEAFEGFDLAGFPVAGKTGTAQVTGQGDFAWFTGFGPVIPGQQPQYVVTVLLEAVDQFGGTVAAPVARAVFDGLRDPALLPAVPSEPATPVPTTSEDAPP